MKKSGKHHYFMIALIFVGVFIAFEVFKVIAAGVSDIESIVTAPFTALGNVWSAITGWLGGIGSAPAPGTVTALGQTAAANVGVSDSSALGAMLDSESSDVNAQLAGLPVTDNSNTGDVVGIWSSP